MSHAREKRKFLYFYVEGKLYKMLRVIKARDEALAWCYDDHQTRLFQWSDVRKRASRGFTAGEVGKMIKRSGRMVHYYIEDGLIAPPKRTYSLTTGKPGYYIFSEEDVYKIQEIVSGSHRGRPRKDGVKIPAPTPSKREIYAQMKYDMTLYVKNKDGEFIPLYAAEDW